jgi:hypothetical protein
MIDLFALCVCFETNQPTNQLGGWLAGLCVVL